MRIRARMLALALGIAVPLVLVGLASLWGMWTVSRHQLDDGLKQQAELVAIALERWVEVQRQPLTTIAAYLAEQPKLPAAFDKNLRYIAATHPHWIDLRIVDAAGETIMSQPPGVAAPSAELRRQLFAEMRRRQSWAVEPDWKDGSGMPVLTLGAPIKSGGAVIARVAGAAMQELFTKVALPNGAVMLLLDPQRRILYRSPAVASALGRSVNDAALSAWLNGQSAAVIKLNRQFDVDGLPRIYGLARAGATDCTVMLGTPSAVLYQPARRQLTYHLLLSLLALLCAVVATLIISRGITLPIHRLSEAARRFGAGDLDARARVAEDGEVAELGAAFNAMAAQIKEREERLAELDRLKSEFVSGVSHELRTPLTTIKTLTRVLLRDGLSETERRAYLKTIASECDRQIDLVLNLLDLSRIEAGVFSLEATRVDACEVVRACLKIESHAAAARAQELCAELPAAPLPLCADRVALRRVLCGLVENAIKYTPDGGSITLSAHTKGDEVELRVADNGRGIAPEDAPHIFEKFYRGRPAARAAAGEEPSEGPSDWMNAPGVGLGLYLARTVIEQMGGRIRMQSGAGSGSIFTISLPLWHAGCLKTGEKEEEENAQPAASGG